MSRGTSSRKRTKSAVTWCCRAPRSRRICRNCCEGTVRRTRRAPQPTRRPFAERTLCDWPLGRGGPSQHLKTKCGSSTQALRHPKPGLKLNVEFVRKLLRGCSLGQFVAKPSTAGNLPLGWIMPASVVFVWVAPLLVPADRFSSLMAAQNLVSLDARMRPRGIAKSWVAKSWS
jgi:hypothetical protein